MIKAILTISFFMCCPSVVSPQGPFRIPNGFGIGLDFVDKGSDGYMAPRERTIYARGLINGLFAAGLVRADEKQLSKLQTCIVGMSDVQVEAILEKYVRDHPEQWHHNLTIIGTQAIGNACGMFKN